MNVPQSTTIRRRDSVVQTLRRIRSTCIFFAAVLLPELLLAQSGSPFDTGFTNLQNLFTGTVAKVASLIAIVIGGYEFAHGEPGAKKNRVRKGVHQSSG